MNSVSTPHSFAARAIRFGNTAPVEPPEKLVLFSGLADGGSLIYMAQNESKKTVTFYVRPRPNATKEYAERLMVNQMEAVREIKKNLPDWTINSKFFDDRPSNAIVIETPEM